MLEIITCATNKLLGLSSNNNVAKSPTFLVNIIFSNGKYTD